MLEDAWTTPTPPEDDGSSVDAVGQGADTEVTSHFFSLHDIELPYPGLRSFESWETEIFFGREAHTQRLLEILRNQRFLAVIGPSGSGKSSLVRAGLLPQLPRGRLGTGTHWRIATMRPGNEPIRRLARALLQPDVLGPELLRSTSTAPEVDDALTLEASLLEAELRRGPLGLVETAAFAARNNGRMEGAGGETCFNLLVLVDQFEELFTYIDAGGSSRRETVADEADAFVNLLLAARAAPEARVFVALTMRTDFLGQCVRFLDLPDAINRAQYLTPRLTRTEIESTIVGPARHFGGDVTPTLVNELINEVGKDPDQLPVLQHALSRMWEFATARCGEGSTIVDWPDFKSAGGVKDAMTLHADLTLANLAGDLVVGPVLTEEQEVARLMLLAVTEQRVAEGGGQTVRRPQSVQRIADWAAVDPNRIFLAARAFADPRANFVHYEGELGNIDPDTVIDISHEALIRQWERLRGWVADEAESAANFRRLRGAAMDLAARKAGASLLTGSGLASAKAWLEGTPGGWRPNLTWASRYASSATAAETEFQLVRDYVQQSLAETERREQEARDREAADQKRRTQGRLIVTMLMLLIATAGVASWTWRLRNAAEAEKSSALAGSLWFPIELESGLLTPKAEDALLPVARAPKILMDEFLRRVRDDEAFADRFVRAPGPILTAAIGTSPATRASIATMLEHATPIHAAPPADAPSQQQIQITPKTSARALAKALARLYLLDESDSVGDAQLASDVMRAAQDYKSTDRGNAKNDWYTLGDGLSSLHALLPNKRSAELVKALLHRLEESRSQEDRLIWLGALGSMPDAVPADQRQMLFIELRKQLRAASQAVRSDSHGTWYPSEERDGPEDNESIVTRAPGSGSVAVLGHMLGRIGARLSPSQAVAVWRQIESEFKGDPAKIDDAELPLIVMRMPSGEALPQLKSAFARLEQRPVFPQDESSFAHARAEVMLIRSIVRLLPREQLQAAGLLASHEMEKMASGGASLFAQLALQEMVERLSKTDAMAVANALMSVEWRSRGLWLPTIGRDNTIRASLTERFPELSELWSPRLHVDNDGTRGQPKAAPAKPPRAVGSLLRAIQATRDTNELRDPDGLGDQLVAAIQAMPDTKVRKELDTLVVMHAKLEDNDQRYVLRSGIEAAARKLPRQQGGVREILAEMMFITGYEGDSKVSALYVEFATAAISAGTSEKVTAELARLGPLLATFPSAQIDDLLNQLSPAQRETLGTGFVAKVISMDDADDPKSIRADGESTRARSRFAALTGQLIREMAQKQRRPLQLQLLNATFGAPSAEGVRRIIHCVNASISLHEASPAGIPSELAWLASEVSARLPNATRAIEVEGLGTVMRKSLSAQANGTPEMASELFELMRYPADRPWETENTVRTLFHDQGAPNADAGQWALVEWARKRFPALDLNAPAQAKQ